MAADRVLVDHDLVNDRISKLIALYDDMDVVRQQIQSVLDRQDASVWSSESTITSFRTTYAVRLRRLLDTMDQVQSRIDDMRVALAESAKSLLVQDEATAKLFERLVERLDPPDYEDVFGGGDDDNVFG